MHTQIPASTIDQDRRDIGLASWPRARLKRRCDDRSLLLDTPSLASLRAGQDLDPDYHTSCTHRRLRHPAIAPDYHGLRKIPFGGRIPSSER